LLRKPWLPLNWHKRDPSHWRRGAMHRAHKQRGILLEFRDAGSKFAKQIIFELFLFFSDVRRFLLLVLPEHQTARLKPPPQKRIQVFWSCTDNDHRTQRRQSMNIVNVNYETHKGE